MIVYECNILAFKNLHGLNFVLLLWCSLIIQSYSVFFLSTTLCTSEACMAIHAVPSIYYLPLDGTSFWNSLPSCVSSSVIKNLLQSSSTNLFGLHSLKDFTVLYAICNLLSAIGACVIDCDTLKKTKNKPSIKLRRIWHC